MSYTMLARIRVAQEERDAATRRLADASVRISRRSARLTREKGSVIEQARFWKRKWLAVRNMFATLLKSYVAEKRRRIYYQAIVYEACDQLDRLDGRRRGDKLRCGCAEYPARELQERIEQLVSRVLEANLLAPIQNRQSKI